MEGTELMHASRTGRTRRIATAGLVAFAVALLASTGSAQDDADELTPPPECPQREGRRDTEGDSTGSWQGARPSRSEATAQGAQRSQEPVEAVECRSDSHSAQEKERELRVDVGWDRGLTYEYKQRLLVLDRLGGPTWIDDLSVRGRVGGSLYLDAGWTRGDPVAEGFDFSVRRARLYTQGRLGYGATTEYKFEFATSDGSFFLNDFYLRWRPERFADSLRVGYFDPPATLQNLVGSGSRVLMEVASPVGAFAPGFRLGVDTGGTTESPSLTWLLNLSTVGQEVDAGDASEERLRLFGRVAWRPFGEPEPDAPLLHLGLSTSWSPDAGRTRIRYRSRPESFLTDYVVDTGDIAGSARLLGLELAWQDGPLLLQAETLLANVDAEEGGDSLFYGFYLQASWSLTGERRSYDRAEAVFGRLKPEQPFRMNGEGYGALELAARLSWLDLSDGAVRGGRMISLTFGPTWTLNRYVRVLAGYVYADVGQARDDQEGGIHILQARLEFLF